MGRALRCVLWLALVVLVGGCFQADQDLVVRADGGGTFHLHAVVDLEAFNQLGQSFGGLTDPDPPTATPSTLVPLGRRDLASGGTVSVEQNASKLVMDARFPFDDPADFDRKLVEMATALASDDTPLGDIPTGGALTVVQRDDLVDITFRPNAGGSDLGSSGFDMARLNGVLRDDLKPRASVSITAPGRITTSNADETHGTTAKWDLLRTGAPTALTLTAETAPAIDWVPLLAAALFLLALAAFVLVTLRRTHVRTSSHVATGPAAAAPSTAPPAPIAAAQPVVGRDPLAAWPDRTSAPPSVEDPLDS
jgi:hypothetical protein